MLPPRPTKISRGLFPQNIGLNSFSAFAKHLQSQFVAFAVMVAYLAVPWIKASFWGLIELKLEQGPPSRARKGGVVVVAPYRGEVSQIQPFIDFYKRAGIGEFVFLDLTPDQSLSKHIKGQENCAVWCSRIQGHYKHAIYWLNFLRRKYASGRWCLSLEPNERFIFHKCETRSIQDLVEFLDSERRDHIYAMLIEMYGDVPAQDIDLSPGEDPAEKLPYFDAFGYSAPEVGPFSNIIVRGGLQRRTLYREAPKDSPALNRIPLTKWRWHFAYISGRRLIMPTRLNSPHSQWHSAPTACLLRYALLDGDVSVELAARVDGTELVTDGRLSCYLGLQELRNLTLKHDFSVHYKGSSDLVDAGLLNPGQWF